MLISVQNQQWSHLDKVNERYSNVFSVDFQ